MQLNPSLGNVTTLYDSLRADLERFATEYAWEFLKDGREIAEGWLSSERAKVYMELAIDFPDGIPDLFTAPGAIAAYQNARCAGQSSWKVYRKRTKRGRRYVCDRLEFMVKMPMVQAAGLLSHMDPRDVVRRHPDYWLGVLLGKGRRLPSLARSGALNLSLERQLALFGCQPTDRRATALNRLAGAIRPLLADARIKPPYLRAVESGKSGKERLPCLK